MKFVEKRPKRPTYIGRNDLPQIVGRNDLGRNDLGRNDSGAKRPETVTSTCKTLASQRMIS